MSSRLETLQVAKLSPQLLGESASLVVDFLNSQLAPDGGFCGRQGGKKPAAGDLYYTIFGLDALNALDAPVPVESVTPFLDSFGDGEELDLIYLSCLVRSWTALGGGAGLVVGGMPAVANITRRLATFRRDDGGWATEHTVDRGSTYGTFLAISAYQDLDVEIPEPEAAARFLLARQLDDGGFAPDAQLAVSTTPTTAAGVSALRQLEAEARPDAIDWLRARRHHQGGFLPAPGAPMPDLLSTAVALHALSTLGASLADLVEPTLDYIDTLWTARGGFHGHWADDVLDCEYTFYGLLALGHLSVWDR